ncbi:hypothetical protein BDA96_04G279400 [Sorghum bicolor]|uniref:Uncharacterized protein n=1 Tax=Sorghum bicolor TaxID=4558 RepID=A0A921R6X7_SORBI|nr:hypothetical protein BDA96_04G279400 [Sorghum bicolor]
MQLQASRSRMAGSLHHSQSPESYVRLQQGRRWRRGAARGFRLCPRNRFSVRRLRAELLTFLGLVGRYVRLLVRKLSTTRGGGGGGNGGCARSGSRRVLVVTGGTGRDKAPVAAAGSRKPAPFIARSNSFYSQAIADCLEFIKRNSVPVEDYGSVSARREHGHGHKIEEEMLCYPNGVACLRVPNGA